MNAQKEIYTMPILPVTQGWYSIKKSTYEINHINKLEKKYHLIICRKALDNIQHPLMIKKLSVKNNRNRRELPQLDKQHLQRPVSNITLGVESCQLEQGTDISYPLPTVTYTI